MGPEDRVRLEREVVEDTGLLLRDVTGLTDHELRDLAWFASEEFEPSPSEYDLDGPAFEQYDELERFEHIDRPRDGREPEEDSGDE